MKPAWIALAFVSVCAATWCEEVATPQRKLVVLPFEASSPELSEKVAMKFRYKFRRTGLYEVPSEIETGEAAEAASMRAGYEADARTVAAFADRYFGADLAIYGTVAAHEVRYRMIRLDGENVEELRAAVEPYTDERSISFIVERLLDEMHDLDREMELETEREKDAPLGPDFVPNGDFEAGGERPDHWMDVDNMVVFYVSDDAAHGKVMKFDTDVNLGEYQAWKARREAGAPLSAAPAKTPPRDPGYDTVGGTTGAPYRTDFFPVDPSKPYRLTFEMKGPAGAKVFVKGYAKIGGELREVGRAYKACRRKTPPGEWETFTRTFHPFRWSEQHRIEALRIQLFPYWPRGTYCFDNIRIQAILPAERGRPASGPAPREAAGP